jgi:hypothetical protein
MPVPSDTNELPADLDNSNAKKCGKCGAAANLKDGSGYCRPCNAEYQRNYKGVKETQARGAGYAEGVEAFRRFLIERFQGYKIQRFSGPEIAGIIGTTPGPPAPRN